MVFDYQTLRTLVGVLALALPIAVVVLAGQEMPSISAYYWSGSRDVFVGILCVVAAFLFAYRGHTSPQALWSRYASLCALGIALVPTRCPSCGVSLSSVMHLLFAGAFFAILTYFCWVFRERALGKERRGRAMLYAVCGIVMIAALLTIVGGRLLLGATALDDLRLVFFAEWTALAAFGVAWLVAGAYQYVEARLSRWSKPDKAER